MDTIKGFDEKQIFLLYDYLVAYEESGIEQYGSTRSLLKEHPELSDLEQAFKTIKSHKSNTQEMCTIDRGSLTNEIYFTINKGNHLLSFLAHLRNSIAHGRVTECNGCVLVVDFANPKYNPVDFTARGCVDFEIIIKMAEILKKIEL